MLAKSSAIVLSTVKYGENSVILKTYTRQGGRKAFIAGGFRSKKGVVRPAMVQPLSLLQLVYYENGKTELKRLKEASVEQAYQQIFYDPVKSSLAMFLAEILQHVLQEEEANFQLYDFLEENFLDLDKKSDGLAVFHLLFLYRLTRHLGFHPEKPQWEASVFFDLMNGVYSSSEPFHPHYLGRADTQLWKSLHQRVSESTSGESFNKSAREALLTALLEYYRLHIKDFGNLRSIKILKELLS